MTAVVVDSSAWIAFFRGERDAVARVDRLLADDEVALLGPIYAEVLSGTRTRRDFELLERLFTGLPLLADPPDLWQRVAEARFALARGGRQASLVDLAIAVATAEAGARLVTKDRDFTRIHALVPFELEVF